MAERWLNDLNYGHPGVAAYDQENREWSFAKRHATKQLKQVNSWNNSSPASTHVLSASIQSPTLQICTNATGVQKALQRLAHDYPQLAPASALVPELALVSAAILSTTSVYDPLVGNLFSLGSITFGEKRDNPRRVAALPAGETGNVLRLALLVKERHGWGFDKSIWLEGPSLTDGKSGYWNEEAAPIQQVCFAQSEDKSSFLAVRLPTKTVFFRPTYHQRRQPASRSPYYDLPSSVIDAHPILSIRAEQSGGVPHADVTFNPDFQLQCGIVDQQNTWSVWDIDYARKGGTYSISCYVEGHIIPPEELTQVGEDGWARILWVGDVNTLLVCNRRHLSIVSIKEACYNYLPTPALFTKHSSEWILDVKIHPRHRNQFFILTSARLFLMMVTTSNEALDATAGEAGAVVLVSWRHYRGSEDFTLQLSTQMLAEDETGVLLYSRVNNLIQMYVFHQHASGAAAFISSSNPVVVKLAIGETEQITQINTEPLHFGERGQQGHDPGPGHSYMQGNLRFYRLFVTLSDLSVHQVIMHAHDTGMTGSTQHEIAVDDIMWSNVVYPRKELRAAREHDEIDDFFVADGSKTTDVLRPKMLLQAPPWTQTQVQELLQDVRDYKSLYDTLTRKSLGDEATSESIDISVVTSQLRHMLLEDVSSSTLPLGTLMEFTGLRVSVPDVDEASSLLRDLFSSEHRQDSFEIQRIAYAQNLALSESREPTVSAIYDSVLHNWIGSLPPDVSIRIRQHKERLTRRIAVEIMLASTRIRQKESAMGLQSFQSHDSGITLPILPSMPIDNDQPQWLSSQTQSSMLHVSQPQSPLVTSSFTQPTACDPLVRLGKYLRISHPSSNIAQNVNQLLAHWQLGTDPHTYDWDATERTLRPEKLTEFSEEQREKMRRRQERREKRQKREYDVMRAKEASQPNIGAVPEMFPRSSPGPMFGSGSQFVLSSQVARQNQGGFGGIGGVPQSQVEPGRFGGRPEKKKKKGKGRVSGF